MSGTDFLDTKVRVYAPGPRITPANLRCQVLLPWRRGPRRRLISPNGVSGRLPSRRRPGRSPSGVSNKAISGQFPVTPDFICFNGPELPPIHGALSCSDQRRGAHTAQQTSRSSDLRPQPSRRSRGSIVCAESSNARRPCRAPVPCRDSHLADLV